jgi:multiple sugar transport system permease protein
MTVHAFISWRALDLGGSAEYLLALFLSGADSQTLPLTIAAQNATRGPQWWYMSVLILIMIIPVIAIAIALERYIARGLLVGAVKG